MNFFNVHISQEAVDLATTTLKSGWVSEGEVVRKFEQELEKQLGLYNPVATNSGTSALHLALVVNGIGRGDEVILPAQTFIATGLAILMAGATPVFADIDPMTGNICPASATEKITSRTRVIMPVHWGGYPCEMSAINAIAQANNLVIIDDAAHALGATYWGYPIGGHTHFTAFSFQAIKHLTTGDGGALCCQTKGSAAVARTLRWFGIDRVNSEPSILGERVYDTNTIGYKYHMNNVAAAIGLGNLVDFRSRLAQRQVNGLHYRYRLCDVPGVTLLECNKDRQHAYWLFTVLVENREDFIRKLDEWGVPTSIVHRRIDGYSLFGGPYDLPGQAIFGRKQISLPVHDKLTLEDIDFVCDIVEAGW